MTLEEITQRLDELMVDEQLRLIEMLVDNIRKILKNNRLGNADNQNSSTEE